MRRLLWISSIVILSAAACGQNKDMSKDKSTETEQSAPDRVQDTEPHEAPPHNAPDQDRIDSLKQEKLKEKLSE